MKVLIAMPMYNEELDIGKHLEKLSKVFKDDYSLLIMDDGSTDNSKKIVKEYSKKLNINLMEHKVNQGLATTLNDIFFEASKILKDEDVMINMDSDDTHDPKYIPEIADSVKNGYNFVVLSRYQKGSKELGYSLHKRFMSLCLNLVLKIIFPIRLLKDYTSGYRGFRGDLVKKLVNKYERKIITAKGFAGMAEIMIKLREFGLNVKEIPLIYRYDLKQGVSKLSLWTTIIEYSKLIIKAKFGFLK